MEGWFGQSLQFNYIQRLKQFDFLVCSITSLLSSVLHLTIGVDVSEIIKTSAGIASFSNVAIIYEELKRTATKL